MIQPRRLLVDENVPEAEQWFGQLGEVVRFKGRELKPAQLAGAHALIVRSVTRVDGNLLTDDAALDFVGTCTIGCDHVDRDLLSARGIGFANAPGCNANSVIEYVLTALAVLDVNVTAHPVGIVGAGNVGGRLLTRLQALGVQACAYDPLLAPDVLPNLVPLEQVFACPVVCLHAPLTRTGPFPSRHMIHRSLLERLPAGAVLLSAGRGPVVDNLLLREFARERPDVRLVLDVWEHEPWVDSELLTLARIGTPHIAGYSLDGKIAGTRMVFDALCRHWGIVPAAEVAAQQVASIPRPLPALTGDTWSRVRDVLSSAYDLISDDRRLRAMVRNAVDDNGIRLGFDALRRNYPERREFRHHRLPANLSADARAWLLALGFKDPSRADAPE